MWICVQCPLFIQDFSLLRTHESEIIFSFVFFFSFFSPLYRMIAKQKQNDYQKNRYGRNHFHHFRSTHFQTIIISAFGITSSKRYKFMYLTVLGKCVIRYNTEKLCFLLFFRLKSLYFDSCIVFSVQCSYVCFVHHKPLSIACLSTLFFSVFFFCFFVSLFSSQSPTRTTTYLMWKIQSNRNGK